MTLALARKYRPRAFGDVVGQEHVVRALSNALDTGRLHHAYLLTGTRGVGKTTLARIIARCLNCETGVTSAPCGACSACREIDAGRFIDLLELDAASNTQVDNMRELLENALYAPTAGRFKVYIIDEVHMLSRSAFNAMLKTLEEPPAHVKFILATTDPHKVPVTVLSRCLQFSLKQIPPSVVRGRLEAVLGEEGVAFEAPAMALLARAAGGSLRDGLSLLDQAIAHGGGRVEEQAVREMLGSVDGAWLFELLERVAEGDGPGLAALASALETRGLSFETALADVAGLLQRLALAQAVPAAIAEDEPGRERLMALAGRLSPEDVQLHYQIVLRGRADLPLAPDEPGGFLMTLLRMLAFAPVGPSVEASGGSAGTARGPSGAGGASQAASGGARGAAGGGAAGPSRGADAGASRPDAAAGPRASAPGEARGTRPESGRAPAPELPCEAMAVTGAAVAERLATARPAPGEPGGAVLDARSWPDVVAGLRPGQARMLGEQAVLETAEPGRLALRVPESARHLAEPAYRDKLRAVLEDRFGALRIEVAVGGAEGETLAARESRQREQRQERAASAIESDPFVRDLVEQFDGRVVQGSIRPL